MMENELKAGPPQTTFFTLVLKTFAGLGGGVVGTLILLVFFLLGASILQPGFEGTPEAELPPMFIFLFIAMVFLTTLGANVSASLLFSFVHQEAYKKQTTALTQIFIVNLVILGIMAPVYVIVFGFGLDLVAVLAGVHAMIAALASMMALEIIGNVRYALVGMYGSIFSILFSTGVIFLFYQFTDRNFVILLFITMPLIWMFMGFIGTIVRMAYGWIWQIYGSDFLAASTSYGRDYGEPEREETLDPDVEGSEFLRKG